MAGALLSGSAAAQPPAGPPADRPIIVEGRRAGETEVQDFVAAMTPAPIDGHIVRFERAVCPRVVGLPSEQKDWIAQRMRAVGRAAGIPVGRESCRANILVVVAADKSRFIEQLARRYPGYFGGRPPREIARLRDAPGPTALWHTQGLVDAYGREIGNDFGSGLPVLRTTRPPSRLSESAHHDYAGAILVIQQDALTGFSTAQLADYAAMRTLTGADPARLPGSAPATILTLLDTAMGEAAPVTLTPWDLSFVTALYASNASAYAAAQRGEISGRMRREQRR